MHVVETRDDGSGRRGCFEEAIGDEVGWTCSRCFLSTMNQKRSRLSHSLDPLQKVGAAPDTISLRLKMIQLSDSWTTSGPPTLRPLHGSVLTWIRHGMTGMIRRLEPARGRRMGMVLWANRAKLEHASRVVSARQERGPEFFSTCPMVAC